MIAFLKLIRIEKSLFNAISIFFPICYISFDISLSLNYSVPVFLIAATGFIINDVNDVDTDKINNPSRVIPNNKISVNNAIILYYVFLAVTLLAIKLLVPFKFVYLYLVSLVLVTNYEYIVKSFPYLKNLYVLIVVTIHFMILYLVISFDALIIITLIINILCKEICNDIRDLKGDGNTFAKILGIEKAGISILILQFLILCLLSIYILREFSFIRSILLLLILVLTVYNAFFWFKNDTLELKKNVNIMAAQTILIYGLIL